MNGIRRMTILTAALLVGMATFSALAQEKQKVEVKPAEKDTFIFIQQKDDGTKGTFNVRVPGPQDTIFTMTPGAPGMSWVGQGQEGRMQTFSFAMGEMGFDNKVVKGAPFSADAVTEFTQTLADGNRISRKSSSQLHRDGEGRTRREFAPFAFNLMPGMPERKNTVQIFDPMTNTMLILDPESKTASKGMTFIRTQTLPEKVIRPLGPGEEMNLLKLHGGGLPGNALKRVQPTYPPEAKAAGVQGPVQVEITINDQGDVIEVNPITGHPLLRASAAEAARQWKFKTTEIEGKQVKVKGVLTFNFTLADRPDTAINQTVLPRKMALAEKRNLRQESLGKQTIEGIEVEGTRTVETIPAGEIGNEQPIEIVSERWYSNELQTVILSRHNDPRFGENVYRLINITRSEPDPALFQVPSDYTLKEGPADVPRRVEMRVVKPDGNER